MKYLKIYNTTQEMQNDSGNLETPYVTMANDNLGSVVYGRYVEEPEEPEPSSDWITPEAGNKHYNGIKVWKNLIDEWVESSAGFEGFIHLADGHDGSFQMTISNYDQCFRMIVDVHEITVTQSNLSEYFTTDGDWLIFNMNKIEEIYEQDPYYDSYRPVFQYFTIEEIDVEYLDLTKWKVLEVQN